MLNNIFLLAFIVLASSSQNPGTYLRFYVVSDTNTDVVGPDVVGIAKAVATYSSNPAWTASIPGATWIWDINQVSNPSTEQTVIFTNDFGVTGEVQSAVLNLAADNSVFTYINGKTVRCDKQTNSFQSITQVTCDVTHYVNEGLNVITFRVINQASGGSSYLSNPAGLLYKLTVDSFVNN